MGFYDYLLFKELLSVYVFFELDFDCGFLVKFFLDYNELVIFFYYVNFID